MDKKVNKWTGQELSPRYYDLLKEREKLPISQSKRDFIEAFRNNKIVLLSSPTSSGRSSEVPQIILEEMPARQYKIACVRPRRVYEVCCQVAEEMEVKVGKHVGYSKGFDRSSDISTVLKYITEDALVREAIEDRNLDSYNVIILDDVHERTLGMELLFGFLKDVLRTRNDLKLVVMGASLDSEKFQKFFNGAPLLQVPGMFHHVKIRHAKKTLEDYVVAGIQLVVRLHKRNSSGNILFFLADEELVIEASAEIARRLHELGDKVAPANVVPVYSTLPVDPWVKGHPDRNIVVSNNKAEGSYTIDGIVFAYVIDSGYANLKLYQPSNRVELVRMSLISKEVADQRAQCAEIECFRLYTEETFNRLEPMSDPEIISSKLSYLCLIMIRMGINLVEFEYMDSPPESMMIRAVGELGRFGAVDLERNLTQLGWKMSEFPTDPAIARMLVLSPHFHCSKQILSISAMLSVPDCSIRLPRKAREAQEAAKKEGDHFALLNYFDAYLEKAKKEEVHQLGDDSFINCTALETAAKVREHFLTATEKVGIKICDVKELPKDQYYSNIMMALLSGYFSQVAHRGENGDYFTLETNEVVCLHQSVCLGDKPEWVIYNDCISTITGMSTSRTFLHTVTRLHIPLLVEIAPHYYRNLPDSEAKLKLELLVEEKGRNLKERGTRVRQWKIIDEHV